MTQKTLDNAPVEQTTRGVLLGRIESFLAKNPHISPEAFGWKAIKDTFLVERLRGGGDVTTRKLDAIIRYMSNPNGKVLTHGKQTQERQQGSAGTQPAQQIGKGQGV